MTGKERKKFRQKGIFTVTQLSYTFRPRRRGRNRDAQQKYNHALKAVAIRDKKIVVFQDPALGVCGTPVYLDVEGAVDRDFYYLIGMRVGVGSDAVQLSFWADTQQDEGTIWRRFISALTEINAPVLIHYGAYESRFLRRMSHRHGCPRGPCHKIFGAAINLVSHIHGRIYFPCLSNGLKDIADVLGFRWTEAGVTGIQAAYWRWRWEGKRQGVLKDRLVRYNADDCAALEVVATGIAALGARDIADPHVMRLDRRGGSNASSQRGTNIHRAFDRMLKSAHAANAHRGLLLDNPTAIESCRIRRPTKRDPSRAKLRGVSERIVRVPRRRICPKHPGEHVLLRERSREAHHHVIDIAFTKTGCRSVALHYVGRKAHCPVCDTMFVPPMFDALQAGRLWGRGVETLLVYLRVALRLSFRLMASALNELWHANIAPETCGGLIGHAAARYAYTERFLLKSILRSSVVHVDETRINILGELQYVWVLTDGRHVAFRLTKTREARFLRPLFARFRGTLVSDFYPGYDAVDCRQQKCLSHLIRDLNDDLWKNPFDGEFEIFVAAVRDLFAPMFADYARFHGNTRYLRKHISAVAMFYRRNIDPPPNEDELVERFRKRFRRYRGAMFTFLRHDGVPWNNNAAERALRHLAVQRKISNAFSERGAKDYLRFLAIAQSCRFQSKSFLGFLASGLKDLDRYNPKPHRGAKTAVR